MMTQENRAVAEAAVNDAIVRTVLPECYSIINELLALPGVPKHLMVRARRVLPAQYSHSFEHGRKP